MALFDTFSRNLSFATLFLSLLMASHGFSAEPSAAARTKQQQYEARIEHWRGIGDAAEMAKIAVEASASFAKDGEAYLSAYYAFQSAELRNSVGDFASVDAELYPRRDELITALDTVDPKQADRLLAFLAEAKSKLGDRPARDALAEALFERARRRGGETGEAYLNARIQRAYNLLTTQGDGQQGYDELNAALADAARTDHYLFTLDQYRNAGDVFLDSGYADVAEQFYSGGLAAPAARRMPDETGNLYLRYGLLKEAVGQLPEAIGLYLQATNTLAKRYGTESAELLYASDKLAVALSMSGSSASATNLGGKHVEVAKRTLGEAHHETWKYMNNYADMLREIGASARAIEIDKFLLDTRIKRYGPTHRNVLVSVNNLAQDYIFLGNYAEARKYLQQQRTIATSREAVDVAIADAWLIYADLLSQGQTMDDGQLATLVTLSRDQVQPTILRLRAAKLAAARYAQAGRASDGVGLLREAQQLATTQFSATHPLTFDLRLNVARLLTGSDHAAAAKEFAALDTDMLGWMAREIGAAGNRFAAEATRALADDMLYDYARLAAEDKDAVAGFADAAFRWQSMEDGKRDRLRRIARSLPPGDQETRQMLRAGMRLLYQTQELLSSGDADAYSDSVLDRLKVFDFQINERLRAVGFDDTALATPMPTPDRILGDDEAMVQYFVTRKWKADRQAADPFEATTVYAIVTRKDQPVRLVELGDPRKTSAVGAQYQVASLRSTRSGNERGAVALGEIDGAFAALHEQLIEPLLSSLGNATTLFVVPDGALYSVPFSLLRDRQGKLIEQTFTVRMLTRPDALYGVDTEQRMTKGGKAVLAGGLDYASGGEPGAEPLPGTRREVEDIAALLRGTEASVELLTGEKATETALRTDAEGASLVHLATHGSYESEKVGGAAGVDTLWQSGIILSKSGDRRTMRRDDQDGRLYAFELMDWDLSKLDLLVLSACETGRGEESFVSGLRGLPTAISTAGAKRSLLALWPVDDKGTEEFMVQFYRHLTAGKTYAEALRQARRDAMDGKLPAAKDPLVWAAFVMFEN